MGTLCIEVHVKHEGSDPWTVAREAIELSGRIGVSIMVRVTSADSVEVDPKSSESHVANSIIYARNRTR